MMQNDIGFPLDAISQTLGAATAISTIPRPEPSKEVAVTESPEVEDDYQEARSNLKELIGQMMEQVPDLINVTQQAQSDKMYQAAASFIKATADLNISLSKLSKEIKRTKPERNQESSVPSTVVQNNNNVFVGSTEEFLDMMEERKKSKLIAPIDAEYTQVEKTDSE